MTSIRSLLQRPVKPRIGVCYNHVLNKQAFEPQISGTNMPREANILDSSNKTLSLSLTTSTNISDRLDYPPFWRQSCKRGLVPAYRLAPIAIRGLVLPLFSSHRSTSGECSISFSSRPPFHDDLLLGTSLIPICTHVYAEKNAWLYASF